MSGTVVHDYKVSLYIGNRPYHISKGNIFGVVPGDFRCWGCDFSIDVIGKW